MKENEFGKKYSEPIVLALGMFDCVHIAHIKLIHETKILAKKFDAQTAVFTFKNNPTVFYKNKDKLIYNYADRLYRFAQEKVDVVVYKEVDQEFANICAETFLDILSRTFNIAAVVCGEDFTFGKNANGNVKLLKCFCNKNNIYLKIIKTLTAENVKISTSLIKQLIKEGNIEEANKLLGKPYMISGVVINGDGIGNKFLYPTANISLDFEKAEIMPGVYETSTLTDGKLYKSVTSYGAKPTLDKYNRTMETHIIGLSKNLYNKVITVYFVKRLRDIKKFENVTLLKKQIEEDIKIVEQS